MRFFWIPLGLAVALMIPFLIWDEWFTRMFSGDELVIWLRARGALGWAAGILLLIGDLFLPIPGTEPQARATTNLCSGIRAIPARHAITSGSSGRQRDKATIQPPDRSNRCSPFLRSASPASFSASPWPNPRQSP